MTKSTHFLLVRTNFSSEDYARLYLEEIVKFHEVPISIILDPIGKASKMNYSNIERSQACMIDYSGSWVEHFPLIEFMYNNSYHSSIRMAPFEALYGVVFQAMQEPAILLFLLFSDLDSGTAFSQIEVDMDFDAIWVCKKGRFCDSIDVFEAMPEKNIESHNAILSLYLGIDDFMSVRKEFDKIDERNIICWNAMINGYMKDDEEQFDDVARCRSKLLTCVEKLTRATIKKLTHGMVEHNKAFSAASIISKMQVTSVRKRRKMTNGDNLIWALTIIGFEDYIEPLKGYLIRRRYALLLRINDMELLIVFTFDMSLSMPQGLFLMSERH
ncbi:Nuclear transcription factor Y subunit B-3 [Capsicum chinense]|nr:Nuclear transcription factor Y subunit B-3 [Capsicum chinense]